MKRKDRDTSGVVILSCLATSFLFLGYDAGIASAQVLYGSIVGTVTDQANAVVPKTVVTAKNTSTGLSRQVTTDEAGYYSITNLPEGTYDLSGSAAGFRPLTQKEPGSTRHREPAAIWLPQLSKPDKSGSRRHAGAVPERRHRYSPARPLVQLQRPGSRRQ